MDAQARRILAENVGQMFISGIEQAVQIQQLLQEKAKLEAAAAMKPKKPSKKEAARGTNPKPIS